MIDFRYHVVSIVAVFLALTVGIVLGSSLFNEPLVTQLGNEVDELANEKEALRAELAQMEQEGQYRDAFAEKVTPLLVNQRLAGQRVVLVTLPGTDDDHVGSLRDVLEEAGATVSGQVALKDPYLEPGRARELDTLTRRVAPAGLSLPEGSEYERSAAVLADAVVTGTPGEAGKPYEPGRTVLDELEHAGFLEAEGAPTERADLAVLLSGGGDSEHAERRNDAAVALARALDDTGSGAVVAGPARSAREGGVVAAVREARDVADQVSTVDTADLPSGWVTIVYALADELRGEHGQYGRTGRTDGPLPDPNAEPRS